MKKSSRQLVRSLIERGRDRKFLKPQYPLKNLPLKDFNLDDMEDLEDSYDYGTRHPKWKIANNIERSYKFSLFKSLLASYIGKPYSEYYAKISSLPLKGLAGEQIRFFALYKIYKIVKVHEDGSVWGNSISFDHIEELTQGDVYIDENGVLRKYSTSSNFVHKTFGCFQEFCNQDEQFLKGDLFRDITNANKALWIIGPLNKSYLAHSYKDISIIPEGFAKQLYFVNNIEVDSLTKQFQISGFDQPCLNYYVVLTPEIKKTSFGYIIHPACIPNETSYSRSYYVPSNVIHSLTFKE